MPIIWALILWIPEIVLFGQEMFTTTMPGAFASPSLTLAFMAFALAEMAIGIWAFVIYLKCLGQVQGFSAWRALGNTALAGLVVIVPIAIIAAIAAATLFGRP